jgi:hypothetical protein
MKRMVALIAFFSLSYNTYAQDENDYRETDRLALNIPASQTNSTTDIAAFINSHFDTDSKKVRAAYIWVISHIKYSTDSIHRIILDEDRDQLVTFALRRRKGVCQNFAAIFDDICRKAGLRSFAVEGYTIQNNSLDKISHAWNIVFTDNKWSLYDPTWDAGPAGYELVNIKYYQVPPSVFIQSHMPFDPMFQLLNYPVTYKEFNNDNIKSKSGAAYFNYADTLSKFENAEPIERYTSAYERIQNNGIPNSMIKTKLTQLRFEIEVIYQVRDSILYNDAIADYNSATNEFNNFIAYRNNRFKPDKTDAEVQSTFDDIEKKIVSARRKLKKVNESKATLTLDTGDIEYALNTLSNHVKEQEVFTKNYKATVEEK